MDALLIEERDGAPVVYPVGARPLTIGRSSENVIVIDDPAVSKAHAVIKRAGDRFTIEDLQSRNGTRVNGRLVLARTLAFGDGIRIGPRRFRFDGAGAAGQASSAGGRPRERRADAAARGERASGGVPLGRVEDLAELGRWLAGSAGGMRALEDLAGALADLFDCLCASVVIVEEDSDRPALQASREPTTRRRDGDALVPSARVLSAEIVTAALAAESPRLVGGPSSAGPSSTSDSGIYLVAALRADGRAVGFLAFEREVRAGAPDPVEVALVAVAAAEVALFVRYAL